MKMTIKNKKRADILVENIIFIVLNLIFLSILVFFIFSKTSSAAVLEEAYAKQIALMIDSAKPGTRLILNMEDAFNEVAAGFAGDIVSIDNDNNLVTVKLREKGGYTYSFFNDLKISAVSGKEKGEYVFFIE